MLTEVLILSLTDFSFRNGPPMPVPLRKSMAQAFGTTFITVTGSNTDTNTYNEIYEFDVENEAWIERVEKTFTGRLGHMVMLSLPNEVVPCYGWVDSLTDFITGYNESVIWLNEICRSLLLSCFFT